jgi:hypothetical protein
LLASDVLTSGEEYKKIVGSHGTLELRPGDIPGFCTGLSPYSSDIELSIAEEWLLSEIGVPEAIYKQYISTQMPIIITRSHEPFVLNIQLRGIILLKPEGPGALGIDFEVVAA